MPRLVMEIMPKTTQPITAKMVTDLADVTYEDVRRNGESIFRYGTVRRGRGQVMHSGCIHWKEYKGYRTAISCFADCNGNGSDTGRDFYEGNYWHGETETVRNVTCKTCIRINENRFN